MELAQIYHQVEERLDKLDFAALHCGFHRFPFALYNDAKAFIDGKLIDRPAEFIANTSVLYHGAHTAIWFLTEEPGDRDVLASKLAHEMFHAFQNESGETRWADERGAFIRYRYDAVNITSRLEEAACMQSCLLREAPESFTRLLALRKARLERFAYEYDYEARIEQIEGTANAVELAALEQLDPEKAQRRRQRLWSELLDPAQYFPARAVTYLSGAAFLACLRRYTKLDTDSFTDVPFALAALEGIRPCALPPADGRVTACLAQWQSGMRETVRQTLEKGELVLSGSYRLVAWNVYDGTWDGQYAVLTYFIGYLEGDELPGMDEELFRRMKTLSGDFVAEVDAELHLTRVWRR